MTLPLTGTASVENGSTTVVVSGFALSRLSVIPGTTVYLAKVPYFVASLTDSETFELDEPYAGADAVAAPIKVNQIDAAKAATVTLNSAIATYSARLSLLEADGKGLFYTSLGYTGANDPGPGKLARDNADWAQTTAFYIDVLDAGDKDVSGLIDLWTGSTVVIVRSLATRAYASYMMTSEPTNIGPDAWRWLTGLTYIGGDGIIADGEAISVDWKIGGDGLHIDAVGTFAGRTTYNGAAQGFTYLSSNGDGAGVTVGVLFFKLSATSGDWSPAIAFQGPESSPRFDIVVDDPGQPGSGEVLATFVTTVALEFAADMAGSLAIAGANPTATAVYSITRNSVQFATLSFSTFGAATFEGTATTLNIGDVLRVVAPNPRDDTLARVSMTLAATR